ncbi:hypothetical protein NQD34_005645 [Periophthalmus magnuspinnatus]|nr:hypothetical protein NQD34_005645 [Periophthalmus magnuspinnatus]
MAIDFSDCVSTHFKCSCSRLLLHVREPQVEVAEAEQAAFPLVRHAAAVTLCARRFDPPPGSVLQPLVRALAPGPSPIHTTVLIRLIGLDLELPAVPVAPAPVADGAC